MQAFPPSEAAPPTQHTTATEVDQTGQDEVDLEEGALAPETQEGVMANLARENPEVEAIIAAKTEKPVRIQPRRRLPISTREKRPVCSVTPSLKAGRHNISDRENPQAIRLPLLRWTYWKGGALQSRAVNGG